MSVHGVLLFAQVLEQSARNLGNGLRDDDEAADVECRIVIVDRMIVAAAERSGEKIAQNVLSTPVMTVPDEAPTVNRTSARDGGFASAPRRPK